MILVKVERLFLSNMGFVVILRNPDDPLALPIFIGAAEAQAIAIHLQGVQVPRPLTHDLLKNVCDCLECRIKRVEVRDIRDGTFYGQLVVELGGRELEIDCRPSDAIALALRCACPIYVEDKVMAEAGRMLETETLEETPEAPAAETPPAKPRSPLETLKIKLDEAVAAERYEDAARIRDEIARIEKHADN